jgi:hypothetical protein
LVSAFQVFRDGYGDHILQAWMLASPQLVAVVIMVIPIIIMFTSTLQCHGVKISEYQSITKTNFLFPKGTVFYPQTT